MRRLSLLVLVLSVSFITRGVEASDGTGAIFTQNMVIEINKDGKLIFYPSLKELRAMGISSVTMGDVKSGRGAVTADILVKALELFIDDVAEEVCKFKYKPDSFELSIPGVATAHWKTKSICSGKK